MKHKSYESSYATKQVICASLKKLMAQKPLEKITISEIMDDCRHGTPAFLLSL